MPHKSQRSKVEALNIGAGFHALGIDGPAQRFHKYIRLKCMLLFRGSGRNFRFQIKAYFSGIAPARFRLRVDLTRTAPVVLDIESGKVEQLFYIGRRIRAVKALCLSKSHSDR